MTTQSPHLPLTPSQTNALVKRIVLGARGDLIFEVNTGHILHPDIGRLVVVHHEEWTLTPAGARFILEFLPEKLTPTVEACLHSLALSGRVAKQSIST